MGLMLSVLVFCVGVAEILDCWDHLLLHLVQPQYNPIPKSFDKKFDRLSDPELQHDPESRRPSNVNICWPKDLSPDTDLHVIKKRPHEVDHDSSHRSRKASPLTTPPRHVEGLPPGIVIHTPEPPDSPSPNISRESSPNRLELGVIVESDSSSEVDEPSQIENFNYRKESSYEHIEEELSELCRKDLNSVGGAKGDEIVRPKTPRAKVLEEECDGIETRLESETSSVSSGLPVFTDNILSQDVRRVNVHHGAAQADTTAPCDVGAAEYTKAEEVFTDVDRSNTTLCEQNTGVNITVNVQPIDLILDEGLEPIPEFPEIKVQESSPIPPGDDSDSSVDTSDASWMVKSKTSDRPLVIRFDASPEKIKQDFQSVVKTDLRALGDQGSHENKGLPSRSLEKADSIDIYYDALANEVFENGQTMSQQSVSLEDSNRVDRVGEDPIEADNKPSSVNFMQIDNSSSSSLSGIPPLPEDTFESFTQSSLATDNGFSQANDLASLDFSLSLSNSPPTFFLTSDASDHNNVSSEDRNQLISEEVDIINIKPTVGTELADINSPDSKDISSTSNVLEENVLPLNLNENVTFQKQSSVGAFEKVESQTSSTLENVVLGPKNTEEPPTEQGLCQSSSVGNKKSDDVSKKTSSISKKAEKEQKDKETAVTSNKSQMKDSPVSKSSNNDTNVAVNTSEVPSNPLADPLTKDNSNIPSSSQDTHTLQTHVKTLNQPKDKPPKKVNTKPSTKNSSIDSSDTVVSGSEKICIDETKREHQPESASMQTKSELLATAGPSKAYDEAKPSTSKEEDKAFWLIFSGEYTKAMNKDWHSGHFCCWQCDESLTGQRYVLRDEHPYCVKCYESVFANGCEECSKMIGIDSKDLSYKDKHWHEACFLCNKCRVSLVDKQFGSKLDKIFCGNCYDQQFASRCDGCGQIFKAGTKKMEYKTRQWHEPCFSCCMCKSPIGTKSFIPREQEIYCANCYEEKFATRCVKCNKVITSGGVTYKNEPWHRECFTCTHCNTSLAGQRFTSRDEKPYCAECFGELFAKRCTACSKPITGIGGTRFISFEDRHWHNDCFICASCKTTLVGRGFITDGDDIICPECAKQKLM